MRPSTLLACLPAALLLGCAQAAIAPASTMQAGIEDTEPAVTRQVGALLERMARGDLPREQLTERASSELDADAAAAMAARLRPCPQPIGLTLLERKTKGEDRQYQYRASCGAQAWQVEIDFNKAARINKLVVRPARR